MKHCCSISGNTGNLIISETLTIEDASQLKSAVIEALAAVTHLNIDLSGVTAIDLCCLQLLCSAHRTSFTRGKTLSLLTDGGRIQDTLRETGFLRHIGCMKSSGHECLWIGNSGEISEAGA